jgi:predicted transcriptional regulator
MTNNKQQTSVEWYDNEIGKLFNQFIVDKITIYEFRNQQLKLKQHAKTMHKEEIIEAIEFAEYGGESGIDAQQYYTYTFGGENEQQ